ncbi:M20/M25/M40 family metallo-hydrolase [Mariniblastus fucicola]|uniref:Aminopeptidase YwaD n=1 Tax=Mariniblastus fucicola TaxID=980251 RepID=A0A5B9P6G4_9BACT|nr:M20/M25/M40 family metallo-hydrolase [Mariniblastus fucicola]QEG21129.1 Aminopeptidase YwaD precursor [Mariniblastus fucicola]
MFHPKRSLLSDLFACGGLVVAATCFGNAAVAQAVADAPQKAQVQQSGNSLSRVTYDIEYLASDELGGRKPGTPEMKLSEDHIIKAYREAGLVDPTDTGKYFQTFEVGSKKFVAEGSASLTLTGPNGEEITLEPSEQYSLLLGRNDFDVNAGLAFVGYGVSAESELNFDEYADMDVKGKVVVMIRREPQQKLAESVFDGQELSDWAYIATKARAARKAGAKAILLVNDGVTVEEEGDTLIPSDRFGQDNGSVPFMHIKRADFDEMLTQTPILTASGKKLNTIAEVEAQLDKELEPLSQTMKGWKVATKGKFKTGGIETSNIIGVIEGEGPNAHETIVVGAHYDHLGDGAYGSRARGNQRGLIHNGADDNATGTAAVMELARRFAARDKKPGRRIVFICFTAEEMGLLGARHYVENPTFPLEDTVAMINFDMIGWLRDDELTLYGWNTSAQFDKLFEAANTDFNLTLKKPEAGFGGSDHLPFNDKKIPNTFIHTGLTDTYHTPDDDFATIDCEGAVKVIDYTEAFMDQLCNTPKRPSYSYTGPFRLGINVATNEDEQLSITTVATKSIAQLAGLKADDVILKWGDEELKNRRDLRRVIRRDKGSTVTVKVRRGDEEVMINVKLVRPGEEDEA